MILASLRQGKMYGLTSTINGKKGPMPQRSSTPEAKPLSGSKKNPNRRARRHPSLHYNRGCL
jgi:hypothetical protein